MDKKVTETEAVAVAINGYKVTIKVSDQKVDIMMGSVNNFV
ncbi:hypothetical protein ABQH43_09465 [Streptococcus sp. ZJ100]